MMPFLYPTQPAPFPVLVIANQTYVEDDDDDDDDEEYIENDYLTSPPTTIMSRNMPMPMTAFSQFVNRDGQLPPPPPPPPPMFNPNDDPRTFRLRMNVDGFLPNELNVSIRHGRLIVRGKHVVRAQSQSSQPITTNSIVDGNDDTEPDFIAKEFKRTFTIPPNTDARKAHAQFYPQQQVLVVEIPFQNPIVSSEIRIIRARIRPMDIFLTIVTILLMDRALRITYEQFMINEQQPTNTSSHSTHRRRDNRNIFF
jgi:HSP20 family molecular chaperone IbpA